MLGSSKKKEAERQLGWIFLALKMHAEKNELTVSEKNYQSKMPPHRRIDLQSNRANFFRLRFLGMFTENHKIKLNESNYGILY